MNISLSESDASSHVFLDSSPSREREITLWQSKRDSDDMQIKLALLELEIIDRLVIQKKSQQGTTHGISGHRL